jgi:hypothetical protein
VYLLIDLDIDAVELAEPRDLKRLHVAVAHGADHAKVAELLASTGAGVPIEGDDEHIWVSRGWIREKAEGRVTGRWSEDLDHLVTKARDHGWLSEDGAYLRAHVEWLATEEESTVD